MAKSDNPKDYRFIERVAWKAIRQADEAMEQIEWGKITDPNIIYNSEDVRSIGVIVKGIKEELDPAYDFFGKNLGPDNDIARSLKAKLAAVDAIASCIHNITSTAKDPAFRHVSEFVQANELRMHDLATEKDGIEKDIVSLIGRDIHKRVSRRSRDQESRTQSIASELSEIEEELKGLLPYKERIDSLLQSKEKLVRERASLIKERKAERRWAAVEEEESQRDKELQRNRGRLDEIKGLERDNAVVSPMYGRLSKHTALHRSNAHILTIVQQLEQAYPQVKVVQPPTFVASDPIVEWHRGREGSDRYTDSDVMAFALFLDDINENRSNTADSLTPSQQVSIGFPVLDITDSEDSSGSQQYEKELGSLSSKGHVDMTPTKLQQQKPQCSRGPAESPGTAEKEIMAFIAEKEKELSRKQGGVNRSAYTRRILEIVASVRKQREEIGRTLDQTRVIQKEINSLTGKLDRTFTAADELIFTGAKTDEGSKRAYKLLVNIHQNCAALVQATEEKGHLLREQEDIQDQLEIEQQKNTDENLERLVNDYCQVKEENAALEARIKAMEQ